MAIGRRPALPAAGHEGTGEVPGRAHAVIYAGLKTALMNGDLKPGDRLVVRELSERFSTSAMPVREALRQLVNDEALIDHPHRGVSVPDVDMAVVADLFRIRATIEGSAAEWAAATIRVDERRQIRDINEAMKVCVQTRRVLDYLALNRQFHFTLYRAARSQALLPIIERLWLRAGPLLNVMRQEATIRQGLDHHTEIIEALEVGDGARVRRAVVADISDAGNVIQRAAPHWAPGRRNAVDHPGEPA